jgi:dihydrofolate reductase
MIVTLVAAAGRNGVIGNDHGLPWHLPRDLRRFRDLTMGKPIIMGRKTLDQIGRLLPGRQTIVLTRQPDYTFPGAIIVSTVAQALAEAGRWAGPDAEIMVVGGGEIYRTFWERADCIVLTIVDGRFEGTTRFPIDQLQSGHFQVIGHESFPADEKNAYAITTYDLRRSPGAGPLSWTGLVRPD